MKTVIGANDLPLWKRYCTVAITGCLKRAELPDRLWWMVERDN
ncbi:MAG: hypothetical protein ACLSDJ_00680 [Butyricimonas faecihominis]